jgi:hypothetical protein
VQEYATHWEKQEAAKKRIAESREKVGDSGDIATLTSSLDEEYNILKEYNDSYEKALLPTTGAIQYTILDQRFEEDFSNNQMGTGIGSGHRTMSAREKEAEYKRWQTALLAKLPDQPSFGEIGMENKVFAAEERRKRIAQQELEAVTKKIKVEAAVVNDAVPADTDSSHKKKNVQAAEGNIDSKVDDDAMDVDAVKEETTNGVPEVKASTLDEDEHDAADDDAKMANKRAKKDDEGDTDEDDAADDDEDDDEDEDDEEDDDEDDDEDSGGKKTKKADTSDNGNDEVRATITSRYMLLLTNCTDTF